jgi:transcriptional regulator with AAA-type ATPase domain
LRRSGEQRRDDVAALGIAINCAAITEPLLESERFGHENGAFTGAIGLKKGKLENVSSSGVALGTGEENQADDLPPGLGQARLRRSHRSTIMRRSSKPSAS